jgi:hypothetical protein
MDWAEVTYPEYFSPANQPTHFAGNEWLYRTYSDTNTAIGVQFDNKVFITGGVFGNDLIQVGTLQSLLEVIDTRGHDLYAQRCASCHGRNPKNGRDGIGSARNPAAIRSAINRNKGGMSYLKFLTDTELSDIANYVQNPY